MNRRFTLAAFAALLTTLLPAFAQAPQNNNFANAQLIHGASGAIVGSTISATVEENEPGFGAPSVWYVWKSPFTGYVRFDAGGSFFSPGVIAYTGDTLATLVAADGGDGLSETSFPVLLDVTYRIQVATYSGPDALLLTWAPTNAPPPPPTPPANDNLASAQAITGATGTVMGTNVSATDEVDEPGPGRSSVWYDWTAPFTGAVEFNTFGSNYDTRLAAYTGATIGTLVQLAENDDAVGLQSRIGFVVTNGTTYRIRVNSYGSRQGDITLNWLPAVGPGTITIADVEVAETDGNAVLTVSRFPVTGSVSVNFATADNGAAQGQDYTTTTGTLNFADGELSKTIAVPILNDATLENTERFRVNLSGATGGATIGDSQALVFILSEETPANDDFANAQVLPGSNGTVVGSCIGATEETDEQVFSFRSTWYRWTAPANGVAAFDTAGTATPLGVTIYTGTALAELDLVTQNFDDYGFGTTRVTFATTANTVYSIQLVTFGSTGETTLNYAFDAGASIVALEERGVFHEVRENAGNAVLRIERIGSLAATAAVRLTTIDSTAQAGLDYTAFDQVVTLPANQATVNVNIPITADSVVEGSEYFFVKLSDPTGNATLGTGTDKRVVINDLQDDPANDNFAAPQNLATPFGAVSSSTEGASREADEPLHHSPGKRSVWYTYTASGKGSATFRAHSQNFRALLAVYTGASLGTLTKMGEDSDDSDDFAAIVRLPVANGTALRIAVDTSSFRDDDDTDDSDDSDDSELGENFNLNWDITLPGTLGFASTTYTASEASSAASITFSRTGGADGRVTAQLAVANLTAEAGLDYTAPSTEVVFDPGQTMATVNIPLIGNNVFEAPEQVQLTLSAPGGGSFLGTASAVLTINDDDPFQPTSQSFTALVQSTPFDAAGAGLLSFTTNAGGQFTGSLVLGDDTFKFKGAFDASGHAAVTVGGVTIDLQLTDGGTAVIGTVTNGALVSQVKGSGNPFNAKSNSAPQAGAYTLLLPGDDTNPATGFPKGDGAATLVVSPAGTVKIVGTLADGAKFSAASAISGDAELPVFASLYGKLGTLIGTLNFAPVVNTSDANGMLLHFRPSGVTKPANYPPGFSISSAAIASRYVFAKGTPVIFGAAGNGTANFGEGNLVADLAQAINISTKNKVTTTDPVDVALKMKIKTKTGTFSGTFTPDGAPKPVKFSGVVFQKQSRGGGSFLGTSESGFIRLVPAP